MYLLMVSYRISLVAGIKETLNLVMNLPTYETAIGQGGPESQQPGLDLNKLEKY